MRDGQCSDDADADADADATGDGVARSSIWSASAMSSDWADLSLALRRPSLATDEAADVVDDEVDDLLSSSTVYVDLRMDSSDVQIDSCEAEDRFLLAAGGERLASGGDVWVVAVRVGA